MNKIGIIGAGAWGTALAMAAQRAGRDVVIQAHEPEVVESINSSHTNPIFLPNVTLNSSIHATPDLAEAADADAVLVVAPAQHLRTICEKVAPAWKSGVPAVICSKGIEMETSAMMGEVVAEALPDAPLAVLSGPTFAIEVAKERPTGVTLACADQEIGQRLVDAIGTAKFRTYLSDDVMGAQLGGAVKNVLAIACGAVEGRGMGDNTRAMLLTRGLAEIVRLGIAKGARSETLMGLSGIGDITLTCNAMQSRNFSLGVALGKGETLKSIMKSRKTVAEGVFTAAAVSALAERLSVEMPLCETVDQVLNHGADIDEAISGLLARPLVNEI
jgi:glycerol-3-phosphate dehydrogenase (NAD(P)+)